MTRRALAILTIGAVGAMPASTLAFATDAGLSSAALPFGPSAAYHFFVSNSPADLRHGLSFPAAQAGVSSLGGIRLPSVAALGPPSSLVHAVAGFDEASPERASALFARGRADILTLAYTWRGVTVEGSTPRSMPSNSWQPREREGLRIPGRSARFSYRPGRDLVLQFSRGTWSAIDRLVADGKIRRTSLSATYNKRITGGEWQTTLAWGRTAQDDRASLYGYLAETSLRVAGAYVAFARFEQAGVDDLPGLRVPLAAGEKVNKVSVGYYQDLHRHRGTRLGAGVMASRHLLPAGTAQVAGNPTSYMLFLRLKLQ